MRRVLFNPSNEFLCAAADQIRGEDSVVALAPPVKAEIHAPSKKSKNKGYHRIKAEFWIPEEAIIGEDALIDFGLSAFIRLPKDRVSDHLKGEE